jgi:hypothetical protein
MLPDPDTVKPPKKKPAVMHIDLSGDTTSSSEEEQDTDESSEEEEQEEEGELCPHCNDPSDTFVNLLPNEKDCTDFPNYDKLCPTCAHDCWETVGECHLCDKICGLITEQDCQHELHTERLTEVPTQEGDSLDLDEELAVCASCYEFVMGQIADDRKNYRNRKLTLWQKHLPEYTIKPCSHCNERTLAVQCNRGEERIVCNMCFEMYDQ